MISFNRSNDRSLLVAVSENHVDNTNRPLAAIVTNKEAQDVQGEMSLILAAKRGAMDAVEISLSCNANKDVKKRHLTMS